MGRYLPGLSYGQSGGPPPLSWGRRRPQDEPQMAGLFTFQIWKGSVKIELFQVRASGLLEAQKGASRRSREIGGTYESGEGFVPDE